MIQQVSRQGNSVHFITEQEVGAVLRSQPSTEGIDPSALDNPKLQPSLRIFLTLTEFAEKFLEAGWSAESIFWSRYYWFRRFVVRQAEARGSDSGLEQQAFKILEQPFPACSPDWSVLESVEQHAVAS